MLSTSFAALSAAHARRRRWRGRCTAVSTQHPFPASSAAASPRWSIAPQALPRRWRSSEMPRHLPPRSERALSCHQCGVACRRGRRTRQARRRRAPAFVCPPRARPPPRQHRSVRPARRRLGRCSQRESVERGSSAVVPGDFALGGLNHARRTANLSTKHGLRPTRCRSKTSMSAGRNCSARIRFGHTSNGCAGKIRFIIVRKAASVRTGR